jgi:hypothetical protein
MSAVRPTPSADSTRRQLDELDALLQRMLALPVAPPEDELAFPDDTPDTTLAIAEPPAPTPPPRAIGVAPPAPTLIEPPPTPSPPPPEEAPQLPRPRGRVFWVRPLLWSNRLFDRCADSLGGPGRWLQSGRGRAVLGILGLLSLAAAVAVIALDWAGWIW